MSTFSENDVNRRGKAGLPGNKGEFASRPHQEAGGDVNLGSRRSLGEPDSRGDITGGELIAKEVRLRKETERMREEARSTGVSKRRLDAAFALTLAGSHHKSEAVFKEDYSYNIDRIDSDQRVEAMEALQENKGILSLARTNHRVLEIAVDDALKSAQDSARTFSDSRDRIDNYYEFGESFSVGT